MVSDRSRIVLMLACAASLFGGCASVPPLPPGVQATKGNADNDDGWLFKSLTGQKVAAAQSTPAQSSPQQTATMQSLPPAQSSAVQQASANIPQPNAAVPLIPVSAPDSYHMTPTGAVIPAAGEGTVGPPPSIPAALPAAPTNAVSINGLKPEEEKKKGFELSDLAPDNIYKNLKAAAGYGPNEKIARSSMDEGQALFRDKKYAEAAAKFAVVAERWPDTPLEEDALFLQAESEFFAGQYSKAHDTYGGLLKKFGNSRHLDTVAAREFAIGRYWEQMYEAHPTWPTTPNVIDKSRPMFDTFGYAIQAFERIRQYDPTGPLADASLMALGNAYFRRGQFEDAAYNYDMLRKDYPNSKYQMNAHLLDLQAKMRVYQGTAYDQTPLRDAGKIAKQTLSQFGSKLGEERERVAQAELQIVEEKANREYAIAQYYEQHKYYGSARFYYKCVIDEYPTTERAKDARARIEAIANEPDEPPDRLGWLTNLIGTKKR